ncbi:MULTISPECIES: sugar ABC transporter permease [unclassified Actinomyces]|uniref:carbohydrate ABC transporter permease n=1 Tax=unclassified Actinomyces TaxID=2609248 RepID=UPI0013745274|nr:MULTISPECIES: sugar ABC transporter permease [unclassified Actinomyces]MBW3070380.1 sugar ABC transporter permease [Actinomyces sp. 594]NDR53109.1 sugar ABC transporter permease [Actinomyces sp. 565]QHO90260.1 ABC transporter permease [Actinomyces sp. 432]
MTPAATPLKASREPAPNPPTRTQRRGSMSRRDKLGRLDFVVSPYLYIAPFFVVFAITGLYPLLYTAWVSFHKWHLIGGDQGFTGVDNYVNVLQQPNFWIALRNTFSIFLLSSVPQIILAILIAYVLHTNLRAKTFWRMGVLLPYVVAPVAVSIIFSKLFADQSGMVNAILGQVGIGPIGWHASAFWSHIAIANMVNFRWTGYNALIILAAMQAIPRELYEAATVDGAGRMRQFWSVTIPQLRSTIMFVVINSTIGGLQIFDEPRMFDTMGNGGADNQWLTLTMYLYQLGWGPQKSFGRASAVAWILFLIILLFASLSFLLTRRIASSGTDPARSGRRRRPRRAQHRTAARRAGNSRVQEGALS